MRPVAVPLLCAIVLLGACQREAQAPVADAAGASAAPVRGDPAPAPAPKPAEAVKVEEKGELVELEYAYPAEAAALPQLKALLDADLAEARAKITTEAREGRTIARDEGFPFNPYFSMHDWRVVTDLPGWLSLSALVSEFTGGAHPNHWFDAILWDKAAGKRRDAKDLFVSKEALSAAIRDRFCRQIDAQRRRKREGEPASSEAEDPYWACLDPVEYVVILGSSDKRHFDRIGVLVPPYEAGPYAEGEYEATMSVTPAVIEAVKPEYRSAFAVGR